VSHRCFYTPPRPRGGSLIAFFFDRDPPLSFILARCAFTHFYGSNTLPGLACTFRQNMVFLPVSAKPPTPPPRSPLFSFLRQSLDLSPSLCPGCLFSGVPSGFSGRNFFLCFSSAEVVVELFRNSVPHGQDPTNNDQAFSFLAITFFSVNPLWPLLALFFSRYSSYMITSHANE